MERITIKKGDVFAVNIGNTTIKYFQYIADDLTQLNSNVIRGFKGAYATDNNIDINQIINDEVSFYAHCAIKLGVKMKLWKKVGSVPEVGNIKDILFRDTNDYARKVGEDPIQISDKWYVWRIGDVHFQHIGKLGKHYENSYVGLVINPNGIIELLKGKKYPLNYPQ